MIRIFILILSVYCITAPSFAQTDGTKQIPVDGLYSVQELERRRKETFDEIERTARLLNETNNSAKNSLNRLNLLSQQLLARKRIVAILEQEITAIDNRIKTMSQEIDLLEKDLARTKVNYAKSMQNRQQEHRTAQYKMLLILSAENLAQSYRRMRYLQEYANWQKDEANRIGIKQNEILRRKSELEHSRNDKQGLLTQREQENKTLENEEKIQQKEVRELNRQQKDLQRQLNEKKKQADALNQQIERLITEDILDSKKNATTPASASASGDAALPSAPDRPATNYVMTESEARLSNDFAENKGKLPFPLTGQYAIVSGFGQHRHQELSNIKTNNNGIDIQTTAGAEALTIFGGVVTRVFAMPGYNNNVIIRHGDYLTVYSNLSQVYVKAGESVTIR
ncbi:MAG: peptidoglycan DD-metalloendopeptidase family protein, partial [Bacteroidales bacterium]|nr:peptidoglycan DD-metalloendopeptidase family protein [Bacteroidales bacterium]